MNGEIGNGKSSGEVEDDIEIDGDIDPDDVADMSADIDQPPEDTIVIDSSDDCDNVGDISVEINVDELVANIEAGDGDKSDIKRAVKRRLEELEEEIGDNLEGTYNFNLDEDT